MRWEDPETTSFFFTNFPDIYGNEDMWKVFIKWGKVRNVHIPSRTDKFGNRFKFVKFFDVHYPKELEAQLNTIWIGDYKMKVNIPKFQRENNRG